MRRPNKKLFLQLFAEFCRVQAFEPYEEKMVEGVFGLSETTVADAMTPRCNVDVLNHDDDWDEVHEKISRTNHSRYPVSNVDRDIITGTLISKDLLTIRREDLRHRRVGDLVREPYFVPEKTRLSSMLHKFTATRQHMALVVDEFGSFVGLITLEDILEEIVGEIEHEHDFDSDKLIECIKPNIYRINPIISIGDLCDELPLNFPDIGADTLGGFVVRHFGRMPRRGDQIKMDRFEIHINKVSTRRVTEVRIIVRPNANR